MFTEDNRKNAHNMIDCIFTKLFPARGMAERPEQVQLSHRMLDAMLDDRIALYDAGTGIGKTYAYLVAGMALLLFRAAMGLEFRPIVISTSSIALQKKRLCCSVFLIFSTTVSRRFPDASVRLRRNMAMMLRILSFIPSRSIRCGRWWRRL